MTLVMSTLWVSVLVTVLSENTYVGIRICLRVQNRRDSVMINDFVEKVKMLFSISF